MSQSTSADTEDELLELIKMSPEEAFREYDDRLRELREDVESERVRRLIDYALEEYANGGAR